MRWGFALVVVVTVGIFVSQFADAPQILTRGGDRLTKSRVLSIADSGTVVLTVADRDAGRLLKQWVTRWRAVGATNYLIACPSLKSYLAHKEIVDIPQSAGAWWGGGDTSKKHAYQVPYSRQTVRKRKRLKAYVTGWIAWVKMREIQRMIGWGFVVLFADTDALVYSNPFSVLDEFLEADILAASDNAVPTPEGLTGDLEHPQIGMNYDLNIGFMILRPSEDMKKFLLQWRKAFEKGCDWDQRCFASVLRNGLQAAVRNTTTPPGLWGPCARQPWRHSLHELLYPAFKGTLLVGVLSTARFLNGVGLHSNLRDYYLPYDAPSRWALVSNDSSKLVGPSPEALPLMEQSSAPPPSTLVAVHPTVFFWKEWGLREARLIDDTLHDRQYYDSPDGYLAFNLDLFLPVKAGGGGGGGGGDSVASPASFSGLPNAGDPPLASLPAFGVHLDPAAHELQHGIVQHQLQQVAKALALAHSMGRVLILPRLLAPSTGLHYAHRHLYAGEPGSVARCRVPYETSSDWIFEMKKFTSVFKIRENSFLENERTPDSVHNHMAVLKESNLTEASAAAAALRHKDARLIYVPSVSDAWRGFSTPAAEEGFRKLASGVVRSKLFPYFPLHGVYRYFDEKGFSLFPADPVVPSRLQELYGGAVLGGQSGRPNTCLAESYNAKVDCNRRKAEWKKMRQR